jgi:hypothetical protein
MNSFDRKIPLLAPYALISAFFLQFYFLSRLGDSFYWIALQQVTLISQSVFWGMGFVIFHKGVPYPEERVKERQVGLLWNFYVFYGSIGAILFIISYSMSPQIALLLNLIPLSYFAWEYFLNITGQ